MHTQDTHDQTCKCKWLSHKCCWKAEGSEQHQGHREGHCRSSQAANAECTHFPRMTNLNVKKKKEKKMFSLREAEAQQKHEQNV